SLVVLDELHKYRKWKNFIKGEYDIHEDKLSFLITGSARLNIYRKGGDSLQGRYHHYRLHPFSLCELEQKHSSLEAGSPLELVEDRTSEDTIKALMAFGGFPEPFLRQSSRTHRRWHKERLDRVLREDVRDVSNVSDINSILLLTDLLKDKSASLLSVNNLREDLDVSHRAVNNWISVLENLYFCFQIPPFNSKLSRTLKKRKKLYLWDWSAISEEGARFENLIASHLLKFCHRLEDTQGFSAEMWYLRDKDKRELDFLITIDRKPWFAVEVKLTQTYSHHLTYFGTRLNIPQLFLVSKKGKGTFMKNNVFYTSGDTFLRTLGV
ncbi:ATP-binding protein, partial [Fibrobacterota bacterium]